MDKPAEAPVLAPLSEEARAAWHASFLAKLTPAATRRLLDSAIEQHLPRGAELRPPASAGTADDLAGPVLLVVDGLIRTYRHSDVRQVTIRYVAPGEVFGVTAALRGRSRAVGQVVSDCSVIRFAPTALRAAVMKDERNAWAAVEHLVGLHETAIDLLCENVFWPVRNRVARHLMDLGERDGGVVVVRASHQEIADSVGSVREVVSRVLRQLGEEGLIARRRDALVLCDLDGLHRAAF